MSVAVSNGNEAVTDLLLDESDRTGVPPFHCGTLVTEAIRKGHMAIAEGLIGRWADAGALVDGEVGALHLAAAAGDVHLMQMIIERGGRPNGGTGYSPLHFAAYNGHPDAVRLLIDRGAEVSAADSGGRTPLHEAAEADQASIVEMLLSGGADPYHRDNEGKTALDVARERNSEKSIVLLANASG